MMQECLYPLIAVLEKYPKDESVRDLIIAQNTVSYAMELLAAIQSPGTQSQTVATDRRDVVECIANVFRMLSLLLYSKSNVDLLRHHLPMLRSFAAAICDYDIHASHLLRSMVRVVIANDD